MLNLRGIISERKLTAHHNGKKKKNQEIDLDH